MLINIWDGMKYFGLKYSVLNLPFTNQKYKVPASTPLSLKIELRAKLAN